MSTTIRPEVSSRNQYWITRHRYYELKHFCLQYPAWVRELGSLDGFSPGLMLSDARIGSTNHIANPTCDIAIRRMEIRTKTDIIEKAAKETDPLIGRYILSGVTKGLSYDKIHAQNVIPCGKDTYYHLYRRFFWLLDKLRD